MSNLMFTEVRGVLNDLNEKLAGEKASETLEGLKKFLRGENPFPTVSVGDLTIDLDSTPFIPDGWSVEEHHKGGIIEWDAAKVALHLDDGQKNGNCVVGNDLRKKIAKLSPYNANMLDFLLKKENQHLIPESWLGKAVFFWGTIYRDSNGNLCVRCLYWGVGGWYWSNFWLDDDWSSGHPAAVPASQN